MSPPGSESLTATDPGALDLRQRVLILAPFGRDAVLLSHVLAQAAIHAEPSADMAALCSAIEQGVGAVLVADEALTIPGRELLEATIRQQPPWSDLPVFVMMQSGSLGGRFRLSQLQPLGNVTMLERPLRAETIISSFRMGLRARAHQYQLQSHLEAERQGAAALRESEDHYRHAVELNPQLTWTTSPDGAIEDLSPKWLQMTGLSPDQARLDGWMRLPSSDEWELMRSAWQRSLATGEPYDFEHKVRMADGTVQWMRSRARPRRNSEGAIVRWYGTTENIHERKDAEQRLRESETRYRTLAEALPQLVWTSFSDGNYDYLSRQWLEYTGIPEAEQLGRKWLPLVVHPDDVQPTEQAWNNAVAGGSAYDLEYRLRRRDGVYRWFKARGTPVRDSGGGVEKWFGTCTDIEEQRRVLAEREDLLSRERQARATAELLNRVGPSLLVELDTQRLSQKVTDLATQLIAAEFGALFLNEPDQRGHQYLRRALSVGANGEISNHPFAQADGYFDPLFESQSIVRAADATKDIRFRNHTNRSLRSYLAAPVLSRSAEVTGWMLFGSASTGVFTEVHEELAAGIAAQAAIALDNARLFAEAQQAQETLLRSNRELRRANDDLNQFAYSASHDLQEPLRMVAIYSQMLQRKYKTQLDSEANEYIHYTVQGARRMEMLLKDLLDYTQVVDGVEEQAEPADAAAMVSRAAENLAQAINESGAALVVESLPLLVVKEVHLLQLFQNLLGNALKYRGIQSPIIKVSARRDGRMWRLSVSDNGIGIDQQYTRQVFGLFKRLHGGSSQYEGTGIGLAICQKIVDRYGGRIWVESDGEGTGSNFLFTLPGVLTAGGSDKARKWHN